MATDLELAVGTLLAKKGKYDHYWRYYEGDQPLVYSRDKLDTLFSNLTADFSENWCAVVVDSPLERIQLRRITVADNEAATKQLSKLMESSELTLESDDVHLAAIVTGESYVIAWTDEDGKPEAYYNDPRNVHLFYDPAKPRMKRMGCKWWMGDDGFRYITLYYPDRLEYYRTNKKVAAGTESSEMYVAAEHYYKSFEAYGEEGEEVAENIYGEVPVFHFRRIRRKISSELANVIRIQDSVNKLVSDMMVSAEFGAYPQRYIISNAGSGTFKNSPNEIWDVPASDGDGQPTSVGQFAATELTNYLNAIDKKTTTIGVISRTPKHYFFTQGGDPSGEALIAMEAPLNKKVQKYIDRFAAVWSELARFMLKLDGLEIDDNAIIPHFDKPETVQPYTAALIRKENTQAGIPLLWQMKQEGYTDEEMKDLEAAIASAQVAERETLAAAMVERQRGFDQGSTGA